MRTLFLLFCSILLLAPPLWAQPIGQVGSVTGFPLPRFASLKSNRVNLREGPSLEHRASWVFQRAGLPVEILAEFETWRKIRDSEGSEGWVMQALLSGRRTALVKPWGEKTILPLYAKADEASPQVAGLQSGVLCSIKRCDGGWCRVFGEGFDGYIRQMNLWGVYPEEKVE